MNQEIEGKLRDILYKFAEEYSAADYLHSEENGIKPNLNWRVKNATNKIKELVCSTVPEEKRIESFDASDRSKWGETYLKATQCKADYFNRFRTEILKKWS